MEVVEEGRHAVKPDCAKELLVMDASARLFEDGMPLGGDGPEFMIDRHGIFSSKVRNWGGEGEGGRYFL